MSRKPINKELEKTVWKLKIKHRDDIEEKIKEIESTKELEQFVDTCLNK